MRVLHVIPAVAARYGGPSTAVLGLCRALRGAGVDACIATTDADGTASLSLPLGTFADCDGVPTIAFRRVASESWKYAPALGTWLRAHVAEFDLVHIHGVMSYACVAAWRACVRARVPYVVAPLGTLDAGSLAQKPGRKALFMALAGRRMLGAASVAHCTGHEEHETLRRALGDRAVLLPLGVPDEWFTTPAGEPRRDDVLCLTRLAPRKGLELLIDAFARVTKGTPREGSAAAWRLVIAGDGDPGYVSALRALARASSARDRIVFAGWLSGPAKTDVLRRAAVFALPSFHENFGLSVLEALSCGTPVVISREVQLSPWVADAKAGWITTLETDDIATALARAIADPDERRARGDAARRLAARFRWSSVAAETLQVYRGLRATDAVTFAASHAGVETR